MLTFIVRRLAIAIVVLLVSTFLMYIAVANSGNPLGTLAARTPPPPKSTIDALRHQLNLDKPVVVRYGYWLADVVQGKLGNDINHSPVGPQLQARLGVTARLVFLAMFLSVILAIITGVIAAVRQYSALDYTITFIGFLFISLPIFWFAGLLKDLAVRVNQAANTTIFSTVGESTAGYNGGFWGNLSDSLSHLILPTISLMLLQYAAWSRYQRASMLDVLSSDYMRLARAKGLRWRRVLVRHGLRTALIPLTTVVAVNFGAIIGGAVITETVFGWHGMGEFLLNGIRSVDTNIVLGWLLIAGVAVVLFNLLADILYAWLDPRIRLG